MRRICDDCRARMALTANAAMAVLGDPEASEADRLIAAEEASQAITILTLPGGARR